MISILRAKTSARGVLFRLLATAGAVLPSELAAETSPPAAIVPAAYTACAVPQGVGTASHIVPLKDGSKSVLFFDRRGDATSSWRLFDAQQNKTVGVTAPTETLKDRRLTSGMGVTWVLPNGTVLLKEGYLWVLYQPIGRRLIPLNIPDVSYIYGVYPVRSSPDLMLVANSGLYQYNFATDKTSVLLSFGGLDLALIGKSSRVVLPNNTLVVATSTGLYSFDQRLVQLLTSPSQAVGLWDKNSALIISGQDWYVYNSANKKLERLKGMPRFSADDIITSKRISPYQDLLLESNGDLYVVDGLSSARPLLHQQDIRFDDAWTFPDGDVLFVGDTTVFWFSSAARSLDGAKLQAVPTIIPVKDGFLIGDPQARTWYAAHDGEHRFIELQPPITVDAYRGADAADGSTILFGGDAVYKYAPGTGEFTLIAKVPAGFRSVDVLRKRLVLMEHEETHEWRMLDTDTGNIRSLGIARPMQKKPSYTDNYKAGYNKTFELASGEFLIQTKSQNLYRFTEAEPSLTPVLTPDDMEVIYHANDLPNGSTLLRGLSDGLYFLPVSLADAQVRPVEPKQFDQPRQVDKPVDLIVTMSHPCARYVDKMELHFDVRLNDGPPRTESAKLVSNTEDAATLIGSFPLNKPGKWSLQLANEKANIGKPIEIVVAAPTLLQRVNVAKAWIALLSTVVCAGLFVGLIVLSHWSATAFRLLSDTVWAKWLTWPFFFLRHVSAVQRWILAPWFAETRKSTSVGVPYIDPPVRAGRNQMLASALLERLTHSSRIWLRGESGMGKSSVFAAWERAYFHEQESLGKAVGRFQFILVPLRLREFAEIPVPDAGRPETWLIEAVRRALERAGFRTTERNLVEAMLNAGQFALALDGVNEVDRGSSIDAFAAQFRGVPIIATSRSLPAGSWETWQLPPDIRDLQVALLTLWLGEARAQILAKRIMQSGLGDNIFSGYDVRLVADLFADDDSRDLPGNRVELYLAILEKADAYAAEPLQLAGLKRLAWTMLVLENRREIRPPDVIVIGQGTLSALARDNVRIVRQNGANFEFRHDQMRAFLAALWLIDDSASQSSLEATLINDKAFGVSRSEQQELWEFVSLLIENEPLVSLWRFAGRDAERRSLLISALQREAEARALELTIAPSESASRSRTSR